LVGYPTAHRAAAIAPARLPARAGQADAERATAKHAAPPGPGRQPLARPALAGATGVRRAQSGRPANRADRLVSTAGTGAWPAPIGGAAGPLHRNTPGRITPGPGGTADAPQARAAIRRGRCAGRADRANRQASAGQSLLYRR